MLNIRELFCIYLPWLLHKRRPRRRHPSAAMFYCLYLYITTFFLTNLTFLLRYVLKNSNMNPTLMKEDIKLCISVKKVYIFLAKIRNLC